MSGRTSIDERSPYRRRLAALKVVAPETLRARIRRELRAALPAARG